jgi:uncharacterized membrane protein
MVMKTRSAIRKTARILLGIMLLFTGTAHLTWARKAFLAQVPDWLPLNRDFVVVSSGIVELALGVGLIFLVSRQNLMGWIAVVFFAAIFPGNIAQLMDHRDAFGLNTDLARSIRLFFQPLLVVWALWATGIWPAEKRSPTFQEFWQGRRP